MNKKQALQKIEELKNFIQREEINGSIRRFSFKVISNEYLLQHE